MICVFSGTTRAGDWRGLASSVRVLFPKAHKQVAYSIASSIHKQTPPSLLLATVTAACTWKPRATRPTGTCGVVFVFADATRGDTRNINTKKGGLLRQGLVALRNAILEKDGTSLARHQLRRPHAHLVEKEEAVRVLRSTTPTKLLKVCRSDSRSRRTGGVPKLTYIHGAPQPRGGAGLVWGGSAQAVCCLCHVLSTTITHVAY